MKNQIEQIIAILTKTETDLQKVIVEAASAGDYRGVDTARAAAVSVHELSTRISDPSSAVKTFKLQTKSIAKESPHKRKSSPKKSARSRYPKFELRNGSLIRIGWSKKQRCEYTHKVPTAVFNQTIKVMAALAKSGAGPFMAEQVIEQINNVESEAVPSYQVYVVIGFLRKTNCIKQVGREGYNILPDLAARAEKEWKGVSCKRE